MIKRCPRCNQNYCYDEHCGDVIHNCSSGKETLDNEDIKAIGNFTDPDGTTGSIDKTNISLVPDNRGQFGASFINDGEFIGDFTHRGNKKNIFRTRKHFEYIDVSKNE